MKLSFSLEFSDKISKEDGRLIAERILESGDAWRKFQAICEAQGGYREPRMARYTHTIESNTTGKINKIDNRRLARIAKLAGAPHDQTAGVDLHISLGAAIAHRQPLFTIHSDSKGQLQYALDYLALNKDIIEVE